MGNRDPRWSTPLISASSATYVTHASTTINAPAALVFRTIRNTETWKDWHKFIPRVDIKKQPEEDDTTDAEFADLVIINTSLALSQDSEIEASLPPGSMSRRISQSSGKSELETDPTFKQFAEMNKGRRGSYASTKSNTSNKSKSGVPPTITEVLSGSDQDEPHADTDNRLQPIPSESLFSSPGAPGGGLLPAPPVSPMASRRGSLINSPFTNPNVSPPSAAAHAKSTGVHHGRRKLSINSIYGELSVRLIVGTQLCLHIRTKLPRTHIPYKEVNVTVTEVSRPPDPANPDETGAPFSSPFTKAGDGGGTVVTTPFALNKSKTHTTSPSGIYRIVWGNHSKAMKFMALFQRVWEIRPLSDGGVGGGGRADDLCQLTTWECGKGLAIKSHLGGIDGPYIQKRLDDTVEGLKAFCESLGGKGVERRDFSVG